MEEGEDEEEKEKEDEEEKGEEEEKEKEKEKRKEKEKDDEDGGREATSPKQFASFCDKFFQWRLLLKSISAFKRKQQQIDNILVFTFLDLPSSKKILMKYNVL